MIKTSFQRWMDCCLGWRYKRIELSRRKWRSKNAFDIIIKGKKGKSYKIDGKANEDYYAFRKELIAPCGGEIVLVVDGIKDNKLGELNPIYILGNTIIIKTENNEFFIFCTF